MQAYTTVIRHVLDQSFKPSGYCYKQYIKESKELRFYFMTHKILYIYTTSLQRAQRVRLIFLTPFITISIKFPVLVSWSIFLPKDSFSFLMCACVCYIFVFVSRFL